MSTPREVLDRLDSRHDELIRKLDELNAQIEQALAQFSKTRAASPSPQATPACEAAADEIPARRAA